LKGSAVKLRVHKSGISYSYIITIPKALIESALKWNPGDRLIIEEHIINGKRGLFIYREE